jgi:hypothetical protein
LGILVLIGAFFDLLKITHKLKEIHELILKMLTSPIGSRSGAEHARRVKGTQERSITDKWTRKNRGNSKECKENCSRRRRYLETMRSKIALIMKRKTVDLNNPPS